MSPPDMDPEEARAWAEAEALCERLCERGDEDSLTAAAMIEGTLDAFAVVVKDKRRLAERLKDTERSLHLLQRLWSRVPAEHRHRAAELG